MFWKYHEPLEKQQFESSSSCRDKDYKPKMISTSEAITLFDSLGFHLSKGKLWNMGMSGEISCEKVSARKWFWSENDIINYVNGLKAKLISVQ